ncbi:hypothetical protein [Natronobiforma cellulositropha]|uniref:hypothetical protein n=1 Tax=Natronobiforma cellulositropha TaxID=1679076 RepID=UPI0021D56F00|nr:hypothetical protein [Natronobiforma cellulositropha]
MIDQEPNRDGSSPKANNRTVVIDEMEYERLKEENRKMSEVERILNDERSPLSYVEDVGEVHDRGKHEQHKQSGGESQPYIMYAGPDASDLCKDLHLDSQEEYTSRRTIEPVLEGTGVDSEMGHEYSSADIQTFRKFSFWSGLAALSLLLSLISLSFTGTIPELMMIPIGILLLSTSAIFLKLWYDIDNKNLS